MEIERNKMDFWYEYKKKKNIKKGDYLLLLDEKWDPVYTNQILKVINPDVTAPNGEQNYMEVIVLTGKNRGHIIYIGHSYKKILKGEAKLLAL